MMGGEARVLVRRALWLLLGAAVVSTVACGSGDDVVERFRVEGAGMAPTFEDGTMLDVLDYGGGKPQRGDIIVFTSPTNVTREFIKRIIGVPDDVVEIDAGTGLVEVNREALDEPYVNGTTTCQAHCGPWQVPERSYFVLGDNRPNSSDSRQGWFVPEENIIGWVEQGPD